jgi:hypothetical protein
MVRRLRAIRSDFGEALSNRQLRRLELGSAESPTLVSTLDKETLFLALTGHPAVEAQARSVASHLHPNGSEPMAPATVRRRQ